MASKAKRLAMGRKQRQRAAQLLERIATGEMSVREVLLKNPRSMRSVRLWTLLCKPPHFGEKGVKKSLEEAEVWPTTRLGNLTQAERERVVNALPPRVK